MYRSIDRGDNYLNRRTPHRVHAEQWKIAHSCAHSARVALRAAAVRHLAELYTTRIQWRRQGYELEGDDKDALRAIEMGLSDPSDVVQEAAARSVMTLGSWAGTVHLANILATKLDYHNQRVRIAALNAFAFELSHLGRDAMDKMIWILEDPTREEQERLLAVRGNSID